MTCTADELPTILAWAKLIASAKGARLADDDVPFRTWSHLHFGRSVRITDAARSIGMPKPATLGKAA